MDYLPADKRELLFRPWTLSLMVIAVLIILALLVPRNSFLSNLDMIGKPDVLSVAYLQSLLKADPDNDDIRLLYVEHLAGIGRVDEADKHIQSVNTQAMETSRFVLVSLRLSALRLLKYPDDIGLRARVERDLDRWFDLPADGISALQWERLADVLLQTGLSGWAAKSYLRLALLGDEDQVRWQRLAVQWLLASGQQEQAAVIQLQLARKTAVVEDARKVVEYYLAADRADRVMAVLPTFIAQYPNNRILLRQALQTALSSGSFLLGRKWGRDWLHRNPKDLDVIQRLIQLELAAGHAEAAFPWASRLVELKPKVVKYRLQLAQISEWTAQLEVALVQWRWLAKHKHNPQVSLKRAIVLAQQLRDYEVANTLMTQAASDFGLSQKEVANLAWLQEKMGNPLESEGVRATYLKKSPQDRQSWVQLAVLREYLGKLEASAATWLDIDARFGASEESAIRQARIFESQHDLESSLKVMRDFAQAYPAETKEFWQVYGDLAWSLEYHADAFHAYLWLWNHGKSLLYEAQRLVILLRDEGDVESTLSISLEIWQRFQEPDVLLLAIDSAVQAERWDNVARLMKTAESQEHVFRYHIQYWLLHAWWMVHENQVVRAEQDYLLALGLVPGDADARTGLIWLWIQRHEHKHLKRYLKRWESDAETQEVYWQAYAAGYREMGQDFKALHWFRKRMQAHPDDMLWMLEYADTLASAGQASGAWRLRQYIFTRVWPESRLSIDYAQGNSMAMMEAVSHMTRRLLGVVAAERWVRPLIQSSHDPVVREFAMRWYFGIGLHSQAVFWLMRQHAARLQVPAWQQLVLAMERNDLEKTQRLIAQASGIEHAPKMQAYYQLRQFDDAWLMAMDTSMGSGVYRAKERTMMLRYARGLASLSPNAAHVGWSYDHVGVLNLEHWATKGFYSRGNQTLSFQVRRTQLEMNAAKAHRDIETELRLASKVRFRRGDWMAYVGFNGRHQSRLAAGGIGQWGSDLRWHPWQGGELGLTLAMNEVSLESAAFRLLGAKDQLKLSLSSDVTHREHLMAYISFQDYQSRDGSTLAQGYTVGAMLGHRLMLANALAEESMGIRLTGEVTQNGAYHGLSPYAYSMFPNLTITEIVPEQYASLGVGFHVQRDMPGNDEAIARMPIYMLDTWLGWQWPSSSLAYSLSASVGMPVFGRDMLSFRGYIANHLGESLNSDALYGVGLWYGYRFSR